MVPLSRSQKLALSRMPRVLKQGISCSSLIEGSFEYLECRTNTADGDQMAEQLINFGFDTEAIRSAIASSAGPLNPSLEQQLEATLEILFQAPVALDETIVESSSTAVPLIRSGSAAAYCSVLDEQKDNFTVLVTEEYRLHSQGVAQPGVPDVSASVPDVSASTCECCLMSCVTVCVLGMRDMHIRQRERQHTSYMRHVLFTQASRGCTRRGW